MWEWHSNMNSSEQFINWLFCEGNKTKKYISDVCTICNDLHSEKYSSWKLSIMVKNFISCWFKEKLGYWNGENGKWLPKRYLYCTDITPLTVRDRKLMLCGSIVHISEICTLLGLWFLIVYENKYQLLNWSFCHIGSSFLLLFLECKICWSCSIMN